MLEEVRLLRIISATCIPLSNESHSPGEAYFAFDMMPMKANVCSTGLCYDTSRAMSMS